MKHLSFLVIAVLGTGITSVQAQGTDTCTAPTVITGTGLFNFDNTAATTGVEGQTEGICNQLTSSAILQDVWFAWTAPSSGVAVIETCNITGVDTKIALYPGAACPTLGSIIACNDDGCAVGYQSNLQGPVTGGNTYVIQLGLYPGTFPIATPGAGQFSINIVVPPANDDCNTPFALAGPGTYAVSNALASTGAQGQSEAACLAFGFNTVVNDVWFTYTPATNGLVTVTTCNVANPSLNEDSKIAIYAGSGCPTAGTAIACNDDSCSSFSYESTVSFTAVCGTTYTIQFGMYGGSAPGDFYSGDMDITETSGSACGTPAVVECAGDTAAMCPCNAAGGSNIPNPGAAGSGCANSVFPAGATLSASGLAVDNPADSLVLTCSNMTGPGLFIQANSTPATLLNFNDGTACALGGIVRMGVVFPTAGVGTFGAPTNPIHIAGAPVQTGGSPTAETKHYQCWYRDNPTFCNPAVSNMSNGLAIVWAP